MPPREPITQNLRSVLAATIRDGPRLPRPTDQRAHSCGLVPSNSLVTP
jgi:hypothetical protein